MDIDWVRRDMKILYFFPRGVTFQNGNDFEGDYEDLIFLEKPSLVLRLTVDVGQVVLEPSASRLREILGNCMNHILKSGIDLPRVEEELFPGESNRIERVGVVSKHDR